VVETVGLELRTHHSVIEPVSAKVRNGIFHCGDRGSKSGSPLGRDWYGDFDKLAKAGVSQQSCKGTHPSSSPGDWVVETVGLKLRTHHPVIEPVSASAGNGNFRCGDRGPKSGSPLGRDRYGDYEKRAKARISGE
jgi:hypothetical protein